MRVLSKFVQFPQIFDDKILMNRPAYLRSFAAFVKEVQFKAGAWEKLTVQQNKWWREQWDKIKKEYQVKVAKVRRQIITIKIRERLDYGIRGWEQAVMNSYPMTAEQRQLYRGYFLQSNQSKTNTAALYEVLELLYQLEKIIGWKNYQYHQSAKVSNAKRRAKMKERKSQKTQQYSEKVGVIANKGEIKQKKKSSKAQNRQKKDYGNDDYQQEYFQQQDENSSSQDSSDSSSSSSSSSGSEQSEDKVIYQQKQQREQDYNEFIDGDIDEKYF